MGCTQRLLSRDVIKLIRSHLTIGGSHFGPQVLLEVIQHGIPFVEIPMNYCARVGESSVTGSFWKAWVLGWRMILLVLSYRFGLYARTRTRWREARQPGMIQATTSLAALAREVHQRPEAGVETEVDSGIVKR